MTVRFSRPLRNNAILASVVIAMAKLYEKLDDRLRDFIARQKMFFVASAPLAPDGHVNVSPKGFDSFRILDDTTVAYLDWFGSGVESIAHIKENSRFVIMFCSFDRDPLILRLHGTASAIERADKEWPELYPLFNETRLARSIIKLSIDRITDSCGWGVPMFEFQGNRDQFEKYDEQKSDAELRKNQLKWNMESVDGLPGVSEPAW